MRRLFRNPRRSIGSVRAAAIGTLPANWSTGVVPIPHQDVFLDKVGTVVSSGTVNISSLAVSAGVTLNVTGGSFTIPTSAAGKPLANAGIISIGSGATMTVGDAAHAGAVVNTNMCKSMAAR